MSSRSVDLTPAKVLKIKGNTESRKTNIDLANKPTPKTTMINGAKATSGLA